MARYQTRQVLGGAYRGRDLSERALYTHLVEVDEDGSEVKTCSGVRIENIGDSYGETPESLKAAPSCPVCARKHARLLSRGELTWAPHPGGEEALKPNRALGRAKLETIAWQRTPEDLRGGSGSRREVVMAVPGEGTGLVALSSLTDNELRRYIGHHALVEAGDMQKNGEGNAPGNNDAPRGKWIAWVYGKNNNNLLVFVTREPDRLYYVWYRDGLDEKPTWTYGIKSLEEAMGSMYRGAGYDGPPRGWEEDLHKNASRPEPAHWKNGARTEADEVAARELSLYIENDYALVGAQNSIGKSIEHSLTRKLKNGSFNLELSEIAWMHLMEAGA